MEKLLHIDHGWPIKDKISTITDFLGNHYFDANGIMYSNWYWKDNDLRPSKPQDYIGQSYIQTAEGFTPDAWVNYENSPWVSGLFLWAQSLRYQVTGEEEALHFAAKAFNSLDVICKLSEYKYEAGYLCKPYGGKFAHETSADQYAAASLGLWAYRQIAPREHRIRIDDMIVAMADWWRIHGYVHEYFEKRFDILNSEYGHRHTGMACLHQMAYEINGKELYLKEARNLLSAAGAWDTRFDRLRKQMLETGRTNWPEHLFGCEYDVSRRPYLIEEWEMRGALWIEIAIAEFFMRRESSLAPLLKHVIARLFKYMQLGLTEELYSQYTIQVDLEKNTWYSVEKPPTDESISQAMGGWLLFAYYAKACWGDAAGRIPDAAVIVNQYASDYDADALKLGKRLLSKLDDTRLKHFIDPDGKQLLPELKWLTNNLSSDVHVFAVLAYWRARKYGISLD